MPEKESMPKEKPHHLLLVCPGLVSFLLLLVFSPFFSILHSVNGKLSCTS